MTQSAANAAVNRVDSPREEASAKAPKQWLPRDSRHSPVATVQSWTCLWEYQLLSVLDGRVLLQDLVLPGIRQESLRTCGTRVQQVRGSQHPGAYRERRSDVRVSVSKHVCWPIGSSGWHCAVGAGAANLISQLSTATAFRPFRGAMAADRTSVGTAAQKPLSHAAEADAPRRVRKVSTYRMARCSVSSSSFSP